MHKLDFETFRALLDRLADTFGRKHPDDVLVQAYWTALRDLPIELVQQGAAHHTRYGKFFPKPAELRPKDDKPTGAPAVDAAFNASVAQNERHWSAYIAEGGVFAKLVLADALLARYSIAESVGENVKDQVDFLRGKVANLIRIADAAQVYGDPRTCGLVRQLFGERAVQRLRDLADERKPAA